MSAAEKQTLEDMDLFGYDDEAEEQTAARHSKRKHSSGAAAAASSSPLAKKQKVAVAEEKQNDVVTRTCGICLGDYPLQLLDGSANPQWRVLICHDLLCVDCCRQLIKTKRELTCPRCFRSHPLNNKGRPSVETMLSTVQTLKEFNKSKKRNEEWMVHFQANQPAAAAAVAVAAASSSSSSAAPSAAAVSIHLCDEIGCSLPAIHHCDLCMWLCAHHDAENHAMLEKEELTQHTRTDAQLKWDRMKASKEKIEKKKQTVMQTEEKAKELKQPLIDMKKEFELLPKKIDDQSIALNEVGISAERKKKNDETRAALKQLSEQIQRWNKQIDTDDERDKIFIERRAKGKEKEKKTVKEKLESMQKLLDLSSFDAVDKEEKLKKLSADAKTSLERINKQINNWSIHAIRLPSVAAHPSVTMLNQLNSSHLLPSVTMAMRKKLDEWMTLSGKQFVNAKMIYRAERDGWRADDFLRCVAEKGPTLMLIKAAGKGYIFGSFMSVSWPKKPAAGSTAVADPSSTCFLFSLTNAYSHPFRLSLVDSSRALRVCSNGFVSFGSEVKVSGEPTRYSNCNLFKSCWLANDGTHVFNTPSANKAYQLDEAQWAGKSGAEAKPARFKCEDKTFAGVRRFDAAEIEVFSI